MNPEQVLALRPVLEGMRDALIALEDERTWFNYCMAFPPFGRYSCTREAQYHALKVFSAKSERGYQRSLLEGLQEEGFLFIYDHDSYIDLCMYNRTGWDPSLAPLLNDIKNSELSEFIRWEPQKENSPQKKKCCKCKRKRKRK